MSRTRPFDAAIALGAAALVLAAGLFATLALMHGRATETPPSPRPEAADPMAGDETDGDGFPAVDWEWWQSENPDIVGWITVPGTATGTPDTPTDPTEPENPTDPDTPSGSNLCKWDNVDHGTSFWGRIVKFFHSILYFFAHLFGRR